MKDDYTTNPRYLTYTFLTRECDNNERVIAVSVGKIHSIDRSMSVNNGHC